MMGLGRRSGGVVEWWIDGRSNPLVRTVAQARNIVLVLVLVLVLVSTNG
jgi:hypothetical protein